MTKRELKDLICEIIKETRGDIKTKLNECGTNWGCRSAAPDYGSPKSKKSLSPKPSPSKLSKPSCYGSVKKTNDKKQALETIKSLLSKYPELKSKI